MTRHWSKYFGEIDLDNLQECHEIEIDFNDRPLELTLNASTAEKKVDKKSIQEIDDYIDNLKSNEDNLRLFIQQNFKEKGEAKNYIDLQMEGQEKEDIVNLLENADNEFNEEEQLLSVLYLLRIGFYPEKEDKSFAVLDYTIEEELTDDLLVIIITKDKQTRITIES